MRLDKWLKVSRLIKRRTVANEACDNARVTANGRPDVYKRQVLDAAAACRDKFSRLVLACLKKID